MDKVIENFTDFLILMKTSEITLPVLDIVGVVFLLTVCILARNSKVGLIVAFIFSCKFAWSFVEQFGPIWSVSYVAFALVVIIFSIIECFLSRR
jgi:hypothetical protein